MALRWKGVLSTLGSHLAPELPGQAPATHDLELK